MVPEKKPHLGHDRDERPQLRQKLGEALALDHIWALQEMQRRLRAMARENRAAARKETEDGVRFQMEGQADGYDFVAEEIGKALYGQPSFGGR